MKQSGCDEGRLMDLVLGDLSPAEASEVEKHLEQCAACRRARQDFQVIAQAGRSIPRADPEPGVLAAVLGARSSGPRSRSAVGPTGVSILAAAAAAAIIFLGGFMTGRRTAEPVPESIVASRPLRLPEAPAVRFEATPVLDSPALAGVWIPREENTAVVDSL